MSEERPGDQAQVPRYELTDEQRARLSEIDEVTASLPVENDPPLPEQEKRRRDREAFNAQAQATLIHRGSNFQRGLAELGERGPLPPESDEQDDEPTNPPTQRD